MSARITLIHKLFNKLHHELEAEVEDMHYNRSDNRKEVAIGNIASHVDALHHDFAEID